MTTHKTVVLPGSNHDVMPGAKELAPENAAQTIEVTLKLRREKELPELEERPYKMLGRNEFLAATRSSAKDIDTVVKTFSDLGLREMSRNAATRTIELSGTVSQIENAFQVKLFRYEHPDGNYRGRVGDVHIPAELKDIVVGVFGLDNRRVAHRRRHPNGKVFKLSKAEELASIPNSWYQPAQLAKRYNFPPGDGAGQTVALLEFGGGYFPDDLQQFCTIADLPAVPNVVPVSVDGTSTNAQDGAEGEVMLDIEVVAGICPKATIAVYFAQFTEQGWIRALDAVVQDKHNNPSVISASWGFAENAFIWTNQAMKQVNETLKDAALAGVTVCVSAGDDGSSDAITHGGLAHVDFPASSPYVLAIGGTTIPSKGSPLPDKVWFQGNGLRQKNVRDSGSTGGGVSALFPRPDWQQSVQIRSVNPGAIVGRCIPDLAANADWTDSPYLLVVDGDAQGNGGTSAASPLVASLIALINAKRAPDDRVGYLTPLLYQDGGGKPMGALVCTDVVSGNNITDKAGGYTAGPGYDAASGWGTPDGMKLMQALAVAGKIA